MQKCLVKPSLTRAFASDFSFPPTIRCSSNYSSPYTRWLASIFPRIGSCTRPNFLRVVIFLRRQSHNLPAKLLSTPATIAPICWQSCCLCTIRNSARRPESGCSQFRQLLFEPKSRRLDPFRSRFVASRKCPNSSACPHFSNLRGPTKTFKSCFVPLKPCTADWLYQWQSLLFLRGLLILTYPFRVA